MDHEMVAELAAKKAVQKTFAILGVNVDEPSEVEEFRRDLRFAGDMRRMQGKALTAFIVALAGAAGAAMWALFGGR